MQLKGSPPVKSISWLSRGELRAIPSVKPTIRQTFSDCSMQSEGYPMYPVAVFAARGYAVLRCNPRGSSGYGRDFRYANYEDWGGKDYQDLMAGVDHVIALGVADGDHLGVMGWSYGGYMTSWIITQTKRFKAASVGAGVTDLVSLTGTSDIHGDLSDYFSRRAVG